VLGKKLGPTPARVDPLLDGNRHNSSVAPSQPQSPTHRIIDRAWSDYIAIMKMTLIYRCAAGGGHWVDLTFWWSPR
jgi:hypothetical protein